MYLDNSSIEDASGVYPIDDDDYASASGSGKAGSCRERFCSSCWRVRVLMHTHTRTRTHAHMHTHTHSWGLFQGDRQDAWWVRTHLGSQNAWIYSSILASVTEAVRSRDCVGLG